MNKIELKSYIAKNKKLNHFKIRIKENFPRYVEEIEIFRMEYYSNKEIIYQELVYCYLNDITQPPICQNCFEKQVKFKQYSYGYSKYCSVKCSANSEKKKKQIEQTCLIKYGHKNVAQGIYKEHIKQTNLEKYGFEVPAKSNIVKEKLKQTCIERYGTAWYRNSFDFKQKSKKTCLERYGVEYPIQNTEIKNKILQINIENGLWHNFEELEKYRVYAKAVNYYSQITYKKFQNQINPLNLKRGLKEYHLDHIFPKKEGFKNKIHPELLSHPKNLQMLWWEENKLKSYKTIMNIEDFLKLIEYM